MDLGEPGWTRMGKGLKGIHKMMRHCPAGMRILVLMLTDGHDNGHIDAATIARSMRQEGADIWAVGIGGSPSDVDEDLLRQIVSCPKQYRFIGNWDPEAISAAFTQIVALFAIGDSREE